MINQNNTPLDAEAEDAEADHNCCNNQSVEEDDFVKGLPISSKNVTDVFKAGKSRATVHDVEFLDDDGKCGKTKKILYLKTQRISSSSKTDHHSTDFSEVEAEFRNEFHKPIRSRIQMNTCKLSDDDTKKCVFLKTPKIQSSSEANLFSKSNEDTEDSVSEPQKLTTNSVDDLKAGRSKDRIKGSFLKTQNICCPSNGDHQSLSDYFNEDDSVNEPPKSTKSMTDALTDRRFRPTINGAELSNDQDKCGKTSLKTQRIGIPSESDQHPYSSDFSENEDEFMDELNKSIQYRADAFKAMKSIIRMNTFVVSDDDTNKDSFFKAPDICSPSNVDRYSDSDEEDENDSEKKLPKSTKNRTGSDISSRTSQAIINYVELSDEEGKKRESFLKTPKICSVSEVSLYSHSEDEIHFVEEYSKSALNSADILIAGTSRARIKDFELSDDDGTKEGSFFKTQRTISANADNHSCSDVFSEVEDDCVNDLLKSRISKVDAFKVGKSRSKNVVVSKINKVHLSIYQSRNDTEPLSDEETKKRTFQKTQKIQHPSEANLSSHSEEDEYVLGKELSKLKDTVDDGFKAQKSKVRIKDGELLDEVAFLETQRNSTPLERSSQSAIPHPSIGGHNNIKNPHLSRLDFKDVSSADSAGEREPVCPREETLDKSFQVAEKLLKEAVTQDFNRSHTPAASPIHSTDTSNLTALRSCSPKYQTSFEEFHEDLGNHSVHCVAQFSHNQEKTCDTRISSSHPEINKINTIKNQSVKSKLSSTSSMKIEPKYLGTVTLLDQKVSDSVTVNLLRAAVYHRWLKMKNEKSKENMQTKKKEEEIKKKTEQAKREAAVASYKAWEKKKASLRAEAKQKQVIMRKKQRESNKRKLEKRQSAEKEFEKWKREHDHLLKERYRKEKEARNEMKLKINEEKFKKTQSAKKAFETWKKEHDHFRKEKYIKEKEVENNLSLKKQKEWMERKRNNESVFRDWCEKKQAMLKCKGIKIKKAEEERMREKEDRDKKALAAYEEWLARKDLKQGRQEKLGLSGRTLLYH